MALTRYEIELARIVESRYGKFSASRIVEELCLAGVVDHTLCKRLAVRMWVDERVRRGCGKIEAMWLAADHFCSSYEYVRNCIYYHTDLNL